jgi:hypothetical protein
LGCAVLAFFGSAVAQLGQAAEPTVPPSAAAAAAAEGKVAALAALTVLPADDCSADQAASGAACSEVELTGSDQVTLSNVKPPYFPSGGLEYLVLRCTDSNGAFDGAYQLDSTLRTLFPDMGMPDGWHADVVTNAFLGLPILAARLAVYNATLGVRAQDEAFAPLDAASADAQPLNAIFKVWATTGAISVSNDNQVLGLVFDSETPLSIALGGNFSTAKPELFAAPFVSGSGTPEVTFVAEEKVVIPLDAIFQNIEISLPDVALGVVDSIVQSAQIDLSMRFKAKGPNPCYSGSDGGSDAGSEAALAPGPQPATPSP